MCCTGVLDTIVYPPVHTLQECVIVVLKHSPIRCLPQHAAQLFAAEVACVWQRKQLWLKVHLQQARECSNTHLQLVAAASYHVAGLTSTRHWVLLRVLVIMQPVRASYSLRCGAHCSTQVQQRACATCTAPAQATREQTKLDKLLRPPLHIHSMTAAPPLRPCIVAYLEVPAVGDKVSNVVCAEPLGARQL